MALAAAGIHDFPSQHLGVVGITGTDGKTTTSYLVRVDPGGQRPSDRPDRHDRVRGRRQQPRHAARATSPSRRNCRPTWRAMVEAGDRFAVVESTSHGLAQDRLGDVAYDVAVLTNVTHEHLEFHRRSRRTAPPSAVSSRAGSHERTRTRAGQVGRAQRRRSDGDRLRRGGGQVGATVLGYGAGPTVAVIRPCRSMRVRSGLRLTIATPRGGMWLSLNWRAASTFTTRWRRSASARRSTWIRRSPRRSRVSGPREGPDAAHRRGPAVHRHRRLRPHARFAGQGAGQPRPAGGSGRRRAIAVFGSAGERDTAKRPMMGRVAAKRTPRRGHGRRSARRGP